MTPVSEEQLEDTCKFGKGPEVCIYLVAGPDGFACVKLDENLRNTIDARASGMVAQGNNCEGV